MDYKFVATLVVNIIGLGFMGWQIRIMKQQMDDLPSSRSARRVEFEKRLSKRLYTPVFVMVGLVLLSWLPFIIAGARASRLPTFLIGWGGAMDGCNAVIDTSSFAKLEDKDNLYLVCRILDPTTDELQDDKIAVSKPFQITGKPVSILIVYGPSDPIKSVAKPGSQTGFSIVLLPKDRDSSQIKRLADVAKQGGQILVQGGELKD